MFESPRARVPSAGSLVQISPARATVDLQVLARYEPGVSAAQVGARRHELFRGSETVRGDVLVGLPGRDAARYRLRRAVAGNLGARESLPFISMVTKLVGYPPTPRWASARAAYGTDTQPEGCGDGIRPRAGPVAPIPGIRAPSGRSGPVHGPATPAARQPGCRGERKSLSDAALPAHAAPVDGDQDRPVDA